MGATGGIEKMVGSTWLQNIGLVHVGFPKLVGSEPVQWQRLWVYVKRNNEQMGYIKHWSIDLKRKSANKVCVEARVRSRNCRNQI